MTSIVDTRDHLAFVKKAKRGRESWPIKAEAMPALGRKFPRPPSVTLPLRASSCTHPVELAESSLLPATTHGLKAKGQGCS